MEPTISQVPAAATEPSLAVQVLASGRAATKAAVALQMKTGKRKAATLFRQMQEIYCPAPTLFHLALFSGETDLVAKITRLQKAGTLDS